MAQQQISNQDNKQTGDSLTAVEFNSLNTVINNNAADADTRFVNVEATQIVNGDRITLVEGIPSIPAYAEHNLPTANISDGSLAYNTSQKELVYFKNDQWFRVKDNGGIILVSGLAFVVDTTRTVIPSDGTYIGESLDTQFTLPFVDDGVYNCTIDWNCDNPGSDTQDVTTPGRITHTYSAPGQYTIQISGIIEGFNFDYYETDPNPNSDVLDSANKIIELKNFGSLKYYGGSANNTKAGDAFMKCRNMTITAPDAPDTSESTDFLWMFYQNYLITQVPPLDLRAGNRFWAMFRDCTSLQTLPDLNYNNGVTRNSNAFVETFRGCTSLTTLDNVTFGSLSSSIDYLFMSCSSLTNIPPSCDFTSVTDFKYFMYGCSLITEFPQYNQIEIGNGTDFTLAWYGCALTAQAIENILGALDANGATGLDTSFAGGTNASKSTWTATANTHYVNLVAKGWTIAHNT